MISPDPTVRLRLATRIHFALLRHFGEQVSVSTLLKGGGEAREALWVCEASGNAEMVSLALQFAQAIPAAPHESRSGTRTRTGTRTGEAVRRATPQDAPWAHDTSSFGISRPANASEPAARPPAPTGWLNPANWRRRDAGR